MKCHVLRKSLLPLLPPVRTDLSFLWIPMFLDVYLLRVVYYSDFCNPWIMDVLMSVGRDEEWRGGGLFRLTPGPSELIKIYTLCLVRCFPLHCTQHSVTDNPHGMTSIRFAGWNSSWGAIRISPWLSLQGTKSLSVHGSSGLGCLSYWLAHLWPPALGGSPPSHSGEHLILCLCHWDPNSLLWSGKPPHVSSPNDEKKKSLPQRVSLCQLFWFLLTSPTTPCCLPSPQHQAKWNFCSP